MCLCVCVNVCVSESERERVGARERGRERERGLMMFAAFLRLSVQATCSSISGQDLFRQLYALPQKLQIQLQIRSNQITEASDHKPQINSHLVTVYGHRAS